MADNYLEKRYEEVFGRSSSVIRSKGPGLETLLRKTLSHGEFDREYKVHHLQLEAIVRANTVVASVMNRQAFRFKLLTAETGSALLQGHYMLEPSPPALPDPHRTSSGPEPETFIIVCSTVPEDRYIDIDLGISCQTMVLKASEMGLQGVVICDFDREYVRSAFKLLCEPLALLAIGKGTEKDGIRRIPELHFEDIII